MCLRHHDVHIFVFISGVEFQLVDPGHVETQMTELFSNKLMCSVPTPSAYVKSAIKTIGYSAHTSGYWPHSLELWIQRGLFPNWLAKKCLLMEGKKQYQHAIKIQSTIDDSTFARC